METERGCGGIERRWEREHAAGRERTAEGRVAARMVSRRSLAVWHPYSANYHYTALVGLREVALPNRRRWFHSAIRRISGRQSPQRQPSCSDPPRPRAQTFESRNSPGYSRRKTRVTEIISLASKKNTVQYRGVSNTCIFFFKARVLNYQCIVSRLFRPWSTS